MPLVIAPGLIYSTHLLFTLFCFLQKVPYSADIQGNEASLELFFVVLCYRLIFFFTYAKLLF